MNILDLSRSQAVAFAQKGWINLVHYDICKSLATGKSREAVAEEFSLSPDTIKWVKRKCRECHGG